MKALTIQQPWAWLIVNGWKSLENRTWRTSYRGQFLIHAGKSFDCEGHDYIQRNGLIQWHELPEVDEFEHGGIVGQAELYDIVQNAPSKWAASGQYHWMLRNIKPIKFIKCPGALSLWNPPAEILKAIAEQGTGKMKTLKIQPPECRGRLPYPYYVREDGEVLRQKFWQGKPFKWRGFATKDKKDIVYPEEFFNDPRALKRARRLNPVFEDKDGEMYSLLIHAELTMTEGGDTGKK